MLAAKFVFETLNSLLEIVADKAETRSKPVPGNPCKDLKPTRISGRILKAITCCDNGNPL